MGKSAQFYLPQVLDYSEYDFRNNQAQEALEDAFWESSYSAFSHEDYVSIKKNSMQGEYFGKLGGLYNLNGRTSDKKSFFVEVPTPITSLFGGIMANVPNPYLPLNGSVVDAVSIDFAKHSYAFMVRGYLTLFEPTFTKKLLSSIELIRRHYYFDNYSLAYGSNNSY